MMDAQTKHLRFEVKDAEKGQVEAVFATFDVIDHDGDLTEPGAFEDGVEVPMSAYGHGSWGSHLPVGKGVIRVDGTEARFLGQFFLATEGGREHFETIKAMGPLQDWSYGYDAVDFSFGERDGRRIRILKKLRVHEVCPVLAGAGPETRTVGVKSAAAGIEDGEVRRAIAREFLRFQKTRARLAA